MRVALCQCNLPVGDLAGNVTRVRDLIDQAADRGADLTVFPELSITGYPPEDLLLNPRFAADAESEVRELARTVNKTCLLYTSDAADE